MALYFQTKRQKAGLCTLLLACVFLGGWGRSQFSQDTLSFPSGAHAAEFLISTDRILAWQRCKDLPGERSEVPFKWTSMSLKVARFGAFTHPELKWLWKWNGCGVAELSSRGMNGTHVTLWVVPYWFVITPLTLLSTWLLLTKSPPARDRIDKTAVAQVTVQQTSVDLLPRDSSR